MSKVSNLSEERAVWYWKWEVDSIDEGAWNLYRDIDNEIIENAYLKNEKLVKTDEYLIDLERFTQQSVDTRNEQTPRLDMAVKRSLTKDSRRRTSDHHVQRFVESQIPVKIFSKTLVKHYSPFLRTWAEEQERQQNHFITKPFFRIFHDCYNIQYNIYLACEGIIAEGKKLNKEIEAKWIVDKLLSVERKENPEDYTSELNKQQCTTVGTHSDANFKYSGAIGDCCAWLYTCDSFLFRLLNKALRKEDMSKIKTLGPFIYLLECFKSPCHKILNPVLYRGEYLEENMKECYRQAVGTLQSWLAFVSTSKNRQLAEMFGNTLFIITFRKATSVDSSYYTDGRDISGVSQFPEEEEVLLRSGVIFMVEKFEHDDSNGKCMIYLNVT